MGQITETNYGLCKITLIANADVLTLPSTDVTLIPGVAGRIWLPQFVCVALTPRVADYTNIDGGATMTVRFSTAANVTLTNALTPPTLLAGADNARQVEQSAVGFVSDDFTLLTGAALMLHVTNAAAGNFTGGNVGNTLRVTVFYSELSLVL